eukprot:scaffold40776_cov38-Phaeocystis_antarctica.AAC.1
MEYMVVTLDVSKLSGWLNADASCRESNGGHTVCGARCAGRGAGGSGRPRRTQRSGEGSLQNGARAHCGKSARRKHSMQGVVTTGG